MDAREILIANTKTQKRSKLTTDAVTLGELKAAMTAANIDYEGMTFTEGISKTQLLDDATQLPQNVMYKGQTTNNLVILLTNTKKNIASGEGSRQEAYAIIKETNLQEKIKEVYGRNFTQVSTADLWDIIEEQAEALEEEAYRDNEEDETEDDETEDEEYTEDETPVVRTAGDILADHIIMQINILVDNHTLDNNNLKDIVSAVSNHISEPVSTSDGTITDDDIDDMIDGLIY